MSQKFGAVGRCDITQNLARTQKMFSSGARAPCQKWVKAETRGWMRGVEGGGVDGGGGKSHLSLRSIVNRKVPKRSASARQVDSRRSTRARPLPIRWHLCTSRQGWGHLYLFAQFRACRTPEITRVRAGPPEGKEPGRALRKVEANTWASARGGRALGPERRTCWLAPRAPPARQPPRAPGPARARAGGKARAEGTGRWRRRRLREHHG